jgi:hypothetical protein
MNYKFKYAAVFITGAAAGAVVTWKLLKNKYEQLAQEEIDSVKEVFSRREHEDVSPTVEEVVASEDVEITEEDKETAGQIIREYNKYSSNNGNEQMEERKIVDKPYVISPSEFGEIYEYDTISLTYYADQVLTDEDDELVEDVESLVGFDSLNHFGEYEDDSVFVRNDVLKCDYEILFDHRNYTDVIRRKPPITED